MEASIVPAMGTLIALPLLSVPGLISLPLSFPCRWWLL